MKPNLFALATKELSQDAFLAWLLQWADPQCREHNPELHALAGDFIRLLISLQGSTPPEITQVEAGRQWENIDVWAKVNDTHLIIIEDKTGTGQHSDQLARYRKTGEEWCKENGRELICAYIKTQSDSASSLAWVTEQGFAVLGRLELLNLLDAHEVHSDIFQDFRERLRQIESRETQFAQKKIGGWEADDWKGFYKLLEQKRSLDHWGYVPNPSGGFWCAVLNWFGYGDVFAYMQIEQGPLCFKVGEVYENRGEVRNRLHHLLMNSGGADSGLERPGRFGSGTYMTVACVPRSVWLGKDDDLLDIDSVVERLNHYESWLLSVIKAEQSPAAAI